MTSSDRTIAAGTHVWVDNSAPFERLLAGLEQATGGGRAG